MTQHPSEYFQLIDDLQRDDRWFLGSPSDSVGRPVEPDLFVGGGEVSGVQQPLHVRLRRGGVPLDWTFADFDMPVVRATVLALLQPLSVRIQAIPAFVDGAPSFYILNVLDVRDCLDESGSAFLKWRAEDGRPDRTGQYRQVSRLRIDPVRAMDAHIFRLKGYEIALIVSETIKRQFEQHAVSGVQFLPVS